MTIEINNENTTQTEDSGPNSEGLMTIEVALEKIKSLESNFQSAVSERDKAKQRARKLEEANGAVSELQKKYDDLFSEKSKLVEQFEAVSGELNSVKEHTKLQIITASLTTALESAGAKSVNTVMKLIDKSKLQFDEQGNLVADSINVAIKEVQESDPILFGETTEAPVGPGVKRAAEAAVESAFDKEIKSCKSPQQIEAVLRKYGKM